MKRQKNRKQTQNSWFLKFFFLLSLSVSVALNVYLLTNNQSSETSDTKYPRFLNLNAPVSCENPDLTSEKLPLCPKGKGLKILPNHYPVHSLYIGYEKGIELTGFFQSMLTLISKLDSKFPLMVLVPRDQMQSAKEEIGAYLNEKTRDLVRLVATPATYTVWSQDYFEQAIDVSTGAHSIIDLPYERLMGEHIPSAVAVACNSNLISQAGVDSDQMRAYRGNTGGNIEAVSDNLVAVGNTISREQFETLRQNLDQQIVQLNVNWLHVGHVDEIFSVIPNGKEEACPFDILYASPKLALEILADEIKASEKEPLKFRLGHGGGQTYFDFWKCFAGDSDKAGCRELIQANQAYGNIMERNIKKLKNALKKSDPQCQNTKFVGLPVLFSPQSSKKTYGGKKDNANSIDPNIINGISLGGQYVIPSQRLPELYNYSKKVFDSYENLKLTTIDGDYVHSFAGGIHCAVNIRRSCKVSN